MTDYSSVVGWLNKRGFECYYFETKQEAIDKIGNLIPSGAKVGFGGSMTVKELNLQNFLNSDGRTIYHSDFCPNYSEVRDSSRYSDWYLSSANAITEDGEIVNIDGTGNRVAGHIFGSPNVLMVVGVNKIAKDLNGAIDRIRNIASPINARRLNRKTPCATLNKCTHCFCDDCMCNATVIMHHPTRGKRVVVVLIKEALGF